MRNLSLATRTFLISLLPLCLTMIFTFFGLSIALKNKTREGIRDYVHTSELLLEKINAGDARRIAQAASLLTENAGLKASLGLLQETRENVALRRQLILIAGMLVMASAAACEVWAKRCHALG